MVNKEGLDLIFGKLSEKLNRDLESKLRGAGLNVGFLKIRVRLFQDWETFVDQDQKQLLRSWRYFQDQDPTFQDQGAFLSIAILRTLATVSKIAVSF